MTILVQIHRFPISSVEQLRCQVLLLEVRSPLTSGGGAEPQRWPAKFSLTLLSQELMLLLSLASFLFANVPDCRAAMEGEVSINHHHSIRSVPRSFFSSLNKVESIVWTSEAQASLLTPQQHKVAFRDVVAEKAIRCGYQEIAITCCICFG